MVSRKRGRATARPLPSEEKPELVKAAHDVWLYSADGPRLFKAGEEIPSGYSDSPAKV